MDNRFINIDDLVRQRLGGGEEQERSGAWLRMQELLEKENKRKPFGMLYWKRAMSVVGVVLLLAAVSVGGYEMSSSFRNLGEGSANGPVASTATGNENTGNSANENNTAKTSVAAATVHKGTKQVTADIATQPANASVAATTSAVPSTANEHSTQKSSVIANDKIATTNNNNTTIATTSATGSVTGNTVTAAKESNTSSAVAHTATAKVDVNKTATKTTNVSTNKSEQTTASVAKNTITAQPKNSIAATTTTSITDAAQQTAAKTTPVVAANNVAAITNKTTTPALKKGSVSVAQLPLAAASSSAKTASKPGVANAANKGQAIAALTYKNKSVSKPQAEKTTPVAVKSIPVNNAVTDKTIGTAFPKTKQVVAQIKAPRKGTHKAANSKTAIASVKAKSKSKTALAKVTTPAPSTAPQVDLAANVKALTGKRVIQKIVMHQTSTGTYPNRVQLSLDTISIDRTTIYARKVEAQPVAENTAVTKGTANNAVASKTPVKVNTFAAAKTTAKKNGTKNAGNRVAAKTGNANTVTTSETSTAEETPIDGSLTAGMVASTDPVLNAAPSAIMPEASLTAASSPAIASSPATAETKPTLHKRKKGAMMLENLSSMFNDIKYKISGVQFAPGLTAGINGTFFGPNSFKGFQFGFTGGFEIDEHWSFLTELKYYHRMNNNYSMNDVYYDKVSKDSIVSSFSFSTLHSFELPMSIRYTAGHMSFFGGANFVYTLGVNTGPDPVAYQVKSVSANLATTPGLSEKDFAARFGIGYLFGLSYNVSPNVTLDFRSVQTVWDNMQSSGAKSVSSQLYKSPSLQFSIGYRLGGNKDKE